MNAWQFPQGRYNNDCSADVEALMQVNFYLSGASATRNCASPLVIATILLLTAPLASAVEIESLYTVEVVLDPQDPDARNNAYQTALTEVLVRVTGSVAEALGPDMQDIFPNPGRYVMQFRAGDDNTLEVTLDGPAIETILRQSGKTVWGSERPLTLVWLAVDWGDGEREIIATDDPQRLMTQARSIDRNRLLRERVEAVAKMRGLPVVLPLLDIEDLQHISFSDIWGGFDEQLLEASNRYGTTSILVGRIRPDAFTPSRWSYNLGGQKVAWEGEPEVALNLLGDTLAAEFAFAGNAAAESVMLTISGVNSVVAYGAVQELMASLKQIDGFEIDSVSGDRIRYRIRVRGGVDRLSRALELSDVLEADRDIRFDANPGATYNLDFVYRATRATRAGASGLE
jgi:hypothetical protein